MDGHIPSNIESREKDRKGTHNAVKPGTVTITLLVTAARRVVIPKRTTSLAGHRVHAKATYSSQLQAGRCQEEESGRIRRISSSRHRSQRLFSGGNLTVPRHQPETRCQVHQHLLDVRPFQLGTRHQ